MTAVPTRTNAAPNPSGAEAAFADMAAICGVIRYTI